MLAEQTSQRRTLHHLDFEIYFLSISVILIRRPRTWRAVCYTVRERYLLQGMVFGFSVGDVAALGQIAWKIYKACKGAPESFKNVSQEVLSLHAVLKELEETYSGATLSAARQSRLKIVGDGCRAVLEDLQCVLDKYNSLGTKTKRTWARLGWGSKDIAELRARLISNTVLLTTFVK